MTGEVKNRKERRALGNRPVGRRRYNRPRHRTGTTEHFARWMYASTLRLEQWRANQREANRYKSIPCGGIDGERECKHGDDYAAIYDGPIYDEANSS